MQKLLFVFSLILISKLLIAQELNTAKAIDSVIRKIHWKQVKKVKLEGGRKDRYAKDKNSISNYAFFIHREGGATEYIYYNDNLIRVKHYAKNLPGEKTANLSAFAIYKGEVVSKAVKGREVAPAPLLQFAKEYKEEAKKIIFSSQ